MDQDSGGSGDRLPVGVEHAPMAEPDVGDTMTSPELRRPSMYRVLLLNDDYTPMEFVVVVLKRFFGKTQDEATKIMLAIHHEGVGTCGVYTFDVAQTKVSGVLHLARTEKHPLQCVLEIV